MSGLHWVTVSPDEEYPGENRADVKFECRGDKTSPCHIYPVCECDHWDDDHGKEYGPGHEPVPHDLCWASDWFANEAVDYIGDDSEDGEPPRMMAKTGPIKFSFDYDYVEWEWAEK